ncbi:Os02g0696200, partial [Oryza sativa Japonica Group]
LGGDDEEPGGDEGDGALVEGADDVDDHDGVGVAVAEGAAGVGEDGDEHVLLHVEGARVEAPLAAAEQRGGAERAARQHARQEVAHRQRRHLHRDLRHDERLGAVGEELVEEAQERAGEEADAPHPERPHRQRRVVAGRHRQPHLLDRRRLLLVFPGGGGGEAA